MSPLGCSARAVTAPACPEKLETSTPFSKALTMPDDVPMIDLDPAHKVSVTGLPTGSSWTNFFWDMEKTPAVPLLPPSSARSPVASSETIRAPVYKGFDFCVGVKFETTSGVAQSSGTVRFRRVFDSLSTVSEFGVTDALHLEIEDSHILLLRSLHLRDKMSWEFLPIDLHGVFIASCDAIDSNL